MLRLCTWLHEHTSSFSFYFLSRLNEAATSCPDRTHWTAAASWRKCPLPRACRANFEAPILCSSSPAVVRGVPFTKWPDMTIKSTRKQRIENKLYSPHLQYLNERRHGKTSHFKTSCDSAGAKRNVPTATILEKKDPSRNVGVGVQGARTPSL